MLLWRDGRFNLTSKRWGPSSRADSLYRSLVLELRFSSRKVPRFLR